MSFQAGSLEDVEAWARHEFPAYFTELISIGGFCVHSLSFDGEYVGGKIILQPFLLSALEVGSRTTGQTVYARISSNNDVELFSDEEIASPTGEKRVVQYMKPVVGLADIVLNVPFNHPIDTGHPAGVDRLETLIRYMYLKNGDTGAVQPKLGFFKTHFRAACRDVAMAENDTVGWDDMEYGDTSTGDTPPDLIADTDTTDLRNNPSATSIFSEHVHAMDESYHDFKTSLLRQLGAMQSTDRDQMAQLQAQVHDLEHRLAISEQSRAKLGRELEAEHARSKTTTEEAADWKVQYEGLKVTLQGALGQRF